MLDGKKRYREMTGQDWNQKLVDAVLAKQAAPKAQPEPPKPTSGVNAGDALLLEIKAIGDRVRDLKAQKADKVSKSLVGTLRAFN